MKKTNKRKLVLERETVKTLADERLRGLGGGALAIGSFACHIATLFACANATCDCGCTNNDSGCISR